MEYFFPRIQVKTKKKEKSSPTMEHFFPQIQVETCAQMHTRVKLLGECKCRPYSYYWRGYSLIIRIIYILPHPHRVSAPLSRDERVTARPTGRFVSSEYEANFCSKFKNNARFSMKKLRTNEKE